MDFFKQLSSNHDTKVFDDFDTENHDYQILVRNIRQKNSHLNYFLDDKVSIKRISQKWKLPLADGICRGGYDYSVNIYKGNQVEKMILVCFTCNRFYIQNNTDKNSLFEISQKKFQTFLQTYFKLIAIKKKRFNSKKEALAYWEDKKMNPKLIRQHQLLPAWMKFEGEYSLKFYIQQINEKINPNDYLEEKIKSFGDCGAYKFGQIMASGNDEGYHYTFSIQSSKQLFNKFDEFVPEMLAKNQQSTKGFFDKDWRALDGSVMQLFYKQ